MLSQLFEPDDQLKIDRLYDTWYNYYRNSQGTGKLDKAFASKDYILLRESLEELKTTNREFTILIAERYGQMLRV